MSSPPTATDLAQVWFNGQIVPENKAVISPFDHGLLTGDGVFETMIAYGKTPFAFSRHYRRLCNSASVFGLSVPEIELLRGACEDVIAANELEPARLRITITGGRAPLGSEKGDSGQTVVVAAGDPPVQPDSSDVITVPFPRNEHGATKGLKTISYGENVIALAKAHAAGAREAIFGNVAGNLCEGTGSNIFVVHGGRLITPTLDAGPLPGVTRALVLELCAKFGIEVAEEDSPLAELANADSAFLTSTLREVQPIKTVNGAPMREVFTDLAKQIGEAFAQLTATEVDP